MYNHVCEETTHRGGGKLLPQTRAIFIVHQNNTATALLCSLHYINTSSQSRSSLKTPSIVTFGGPKLCNRPLAQHIRQTTLNQCEILHIVHDKDPVLANNNQLWNTLGYENVGIEMKCDPKIPTIYTEKVSTDEEERSGSFAWNILDHCYYMGVFVGPRLIV